MQLILASASPRRLDLLRQIALEPDNIFSPDIDETPLADETPRCRLTRTAVDLADPGGEIIFRSDKREHVAAVVVDDDDGGVADIVFAERGDPLVRDPRHLVD